jgi:hypothetical protein
MSSWAHNNCEIIYALVNGAEANLEAYIEHLRSAGRDWSPETTAMRKLEHSSRVLRLLAAQIDNAREAMIQEEGIDTVCRLEGRIDT